MNNVPDINVMRETAEEKTVAFNEEFAKSEVFAKMCADIHDEAVKGNFSKLFDMTSHGGTKASNAARELFVKGGYKVSYQGWTLVVSWGRTYENEQE